MNELPNQDETFEELPSPATGDSAEASHSQKPQVNQEVVNQEVKGNRNQMIGSISGETVIKNVQGNVTISNNNPPQKDQERERLIEVVKKEISDRYESFKEKENYINSILEYKPEFLSQIDPATVRKKEDNSRKKPQNIDELFELFTQGSQLKSLLILGEPASGKSTFLYRIAEEMLEKASHNENRPVPVYFSLRSWEGESLEDWLKKESWRYYRTPLERKNWLEKSLYAILGCNIYSRFFYDFKNHPINPDKLVILLDNFELVKERKQEELIEILNKYKKNKIVLCSRLEAFNHYIRKEEGKIVNKLLEFEEAFFVKPPTEEQISIYLKPLSKNGNLDKLKTLLKPGKQLEEITKSLFIFNLVIYNKAIIKKEIPRFEKQEELYYYILTQYIETKFQDVDSLVERPKEIEGIAKPIKASYWNYIKPKAKSILKWLSQEMLKDNRPKPYFFLDEIQPILLKDKKTYRFVNLFIAGLLSFLAGTLHLFIQPVDGWKYAIITGIAGAIFNMFFYLIDGSEIKLVEKIAWNYQTIKNNIIKALFMFPIALLVGFLCAFLEKIKVIELYKKGLETLIRSDINDLVLGVVYTIFIIIMITLMYSITAGTSSSKIKKIKSNQGIWTSSYNAGISGFLVFIFSSFIFFLMGLFIQNHEPMLATRFGVGYGIIAGMLFAIGCSGGRASIKHFTLRFLLFKVRKIPWNFTRFLDLAVDNLEFLQRAGGKFIFLNDEIRDYFANLRDD